MTTLHEAAKALVDRIDRGRKEYQEAWPDDDRELDALRAALTSASPPTPAEGERRRSTGGSTLPGAMTPELVHARCVAVAIDRIRGGDSVEDVERDYGFPGGMLAGVAPAEVEREAEVPANLEHALWGLACPERSLPPDLPDSEQVTIPVYVGDIRAARRALDDGPPADPADQSKETDR